MSPNASQPIDGFSSINSTDVNECTATNNTCDHVCTNTEGSYICSCRPGYFLDSDGKSCRGKLTFLLLLAILATPSSVQVVFLLCTVMSFPLH